MKQLITAIALSVAVAGVFAADAAASKPLTAQQQKMADCSAANKGKKGDEYKAAQKACLSGEAAPASAPMTQKEKMAYCSKQNKGKKGEPIVRIFHHRSRVRLRQVDVHLVVQHRGDDHEDDQQHQHDVHHRGHVDV